MRKIINNNTPSSTAETPVEIAAVPIITVIPAIAEDSSTPVSPPVTLTDTNKNEKTE
jgi:hypothetical protein